MFPDFHLQIETLMPLLTDDLLRTMNLTMPGGLSTGYKSASQCARVVTESWAENNLYCPNCSSPKLGRLSHNTKASDFTCSNCTLWFQLKSQQSRIGNSVPDGAYESMMSAIRNGETPNFYFMQYELASWSVKNLLLIPHFAFPPSAILKRKPLSPSALRAGWIGCNIQLTQIPIEARIFVVAESEVIPASKVRAQFSRVKPLERIKPAERGWTLDVLAGIRSLEKTEFTNEDAYTLVPHLEKLYPGNRHIREKIRQQLQVLRDSNLLIHVERGHWRIARSESL